MTNRNKRVFGLACWACVALVVSVGGLGGCERKPPPPPPRPAPPPPPPPPEPVNVEALLAELGADARVQFPRQFAPTDESLARAIVRLADAVARGDDAALRDLLGPFGRDVLDELITTGEWDAATGRVEAVRVTYVGPGQVSLPVPQRLSVDQLVRELERNPDAVRQAIEGMMPTIEAEMRRAGLSDAQIQQSMANVRQLLESGQLGEVVRQVTSASGISEFELPTTGSGDSGMVVVLAVQEPGEAYVLRWRVMTVGERISFVAVPADRTVRRRAAQWDGLDPAPVLASRQQEPEPTGTAPRPATPRPSPSRGTAPGGPTGG